MNGFGDSFIYSNETLEENDFFVDSSLINDEKLNQLWTSLEVLNQNQGRDHETEIQIPKLNIAYTDIIECVESLLLFQYENLMKNDSMAYFEYPNMTNWRNVIYDHNFGIIPKNYFNPYAEIQTRITKFNLKSSKRKYTILIFVLQKIHQLLIHNSYATLREIFYENVTLFISQNSINEAVRIISAILQVPRYNLRIFASSKGLLIGNLRFTSIDNESIDCKSLQSIPENVYALTNITSAAKFILIVEKDATFQTLIKEEFLTVFKNQVILVTGKGVPDLNTRQMVHLLNTTLDIPAFILVDPDPYGIDIMFIYRFGSLSIAWCSENIAVTSLKWIGVHPTDMPKLNQTQMINFAKEDIKKLEYLLDRPYLNPALNHQLQSLMVLGQKAEIQSISCSGYNLTEYVISKIIDEEYI